MYVCANLDYTCQRLLASLITVTCDIMWLMWHHMTLCFLYVHITIIVVQLKRIKKHTWSECQVFLDAAVAWLKISQSGIDERYHVNAPDVATWRGNAWHGVTLKDLKGHIISLKFSRSGTRDELIELTLAGRHERLLLIHDSPSPVQWNAEPVTNHLQIRKPFPGIWINVAHSKQLCGKPASLASSQAPLLCQRCVVEVEHYQDLQLHSLCKLFGTLQAPKSRCGLHHRSQMWKQLVPSQ